LAVIVIAQLRVRRLLHDGGSENASPAPAGSVIVTTVWAGTVAQVFPEAQLTVVSP
jgi:hypothetical protein